MSTLRDRLLNSFVSVVGWPEQAYQLHSAENRRRSSDYAQQNVPDCDVHQSAAQEKQSLISEGGKCCEATEYTGEEKQAERGRKKIVVFGECTQDTNYEAAEDVNGERTQRKRPRLGLMKNDAPEFVANDGTKRTPERNNENFSYSKHKDSRSLAGVISLLRGFSSNEERQTPLPSRKITESAAAATAWPIFL